MQSLAGLLHTWQWHVSLVPAEITKMLTVQYQCMDPMAFSVQRP